MNILLSTYMKIFETAPKELTQYLNKDNIDSFDLDQVNLVLGMIENSCMSIRQEVLRKYQDGHNNSGLEGLL